MSRSAGGGYDKQPHVRITSNGSDCMRGWTEIGSALPRSGVVCIECYPGAPQSEIVSVMNAEYADALVIDCATLLRSSVAIEADLAPLLSDDPVFGRLSEIGIDAFLDPDAVARAQAALARSDFAIVVGVGAAFVARSWTHLILVTMARWELQLRQRRGEIGNLGADNEDAVPAQKYKRAFFVDWRVGDRIKQRLISRADAVIEYNDDEPQSISGDMYRRALAAIAQRPFRVVPFFDPGPWGGQWMREKFDLPEAPPNFAWCFDCVPEENSLLLAFGDRMFELPAVDLVFAQPEALLGPAVADRFGAEFPIRFDFLDTMGGGNLSLQVHPRYDYAREHFGLGYTQDESYYLLDAASDGTVYLGLKQGVDRDWFAADLQAAQAGGPPFAADTYVNRWPARPHDHFLIPAGTVHGSGSGTMVLEISATPYIFTFKLWDWGRMGLDGRPRPIHLERGLANIDWDRQTDFVRRELINQIELVEDAPDYRIERTGLHALEFIDTERVWFGGRAPLNTLGSVNVLNLVAGAAAWVESPTGRFEPFKVHYAETFIVPASVGDYSVRPASDESGAMHAMIRARVRLA